MTARHWEDRGNVSFKGVTSGEEVDWLHAQVLGEEIRLNQILEHNSACLIRSGAAKTVGDAEIAIELGSMFHNWAVSPNLNPSPEKVKLCTERVLGSINETTEFRVGENIMERVLRTETPDTSTLYIGIANKKYTGWESSWHNVGSRILSGGEAVGLMPRVLDESGLSLSEEQLSLVSSLVDVFMSEMVESNLPHLDLSGRFDRLVVPGLLESA